MDTAKLSSENVELFTPASTILARMFKCLPSLRTGLGLIYHSVPGMSRLNKCFLSELVGFQAPALFPEKSGSPLFPKKSVKLTVGPGDYEPFHSAHWTAKDPKESWVLLCT